MYQLNNLEYIFEYFVSKVFKIIFENKTIPTYELFIWDLEFTRL